MRNKYTKYAGIEYHGMAGITRECVEAIVRLIHFGDHIEHAALLSCKASHCILLTVNVGDRIAIKSGFSSGYSGEGPRGLATAILLLRRHGADIDEYQVPQSIIDAIDSSGLLYSELEQINQLKPIRPRKLYDYIYEALGDAAEDESRLNSEFPATIPYGIVDPRILDLALAFRDNPDNAIISGFRRLEDIVRKKSGLDKESSSRLFAKAFQGEASLLVWKDLELNEQSARATLFDAIYRSYRNPRAHQELSSNSTEALREFLLLNELFVLEQKSERRDS